MKKLFLSSSVCILLFALLISSAQAAMLVDDFNDGNADGWWLGYSHANPSIYGNWRVENGILVQDMAGDGFVALLEGFQISDQTVETQLKFKGPAGYDGIVIWFQDYDNFVQIKVYPSNKGIYIDEWANGIGSYIFYPYYINYNDYLWYNLKVEADSTSGDIVVYVNDVYLFTHHATTSTRNGQSGLMSGNSGGYFDDFKLYSNDVPPAIDIKPGDEANTINLKGMKNISVAILSSIDFSSPVQVDRTSLTFGKNGDENSFLSCSPKSRDVNGDGLVDLVCTFDMKLTGFLCGDTQGVLKCRMNLSGISFEEEQEIMVSPCK